MSWRLVMGNYLTASVAVIFGWSARVRELPLERLLDHDARKPGPQWGGLDDHFRFFQ